MAISQAKKTCRFVREQANLNIGMAGMLIRIMQYDRPKVKLDLQFTKNFMPQTPVRQFFL
jgi:hypothetical protein